MSLRPTILYVDDDYFNITLFEFNFKNQFNIVNANSGKEALRLIEENSKISSVVSDVRMPEMNGIEACSLIRETHSKEDLPIIMVTTKSDADDIALGLASGANDYVTKPVDRKVLMARLESQLSQNEAHSLVQEQKEAVEEALKIQNAMGDVLPDALAITNGDGVIL